MSSTTKSIPLSHAIITHAPSLLPMHYRLSDLAEDLHVSTSDVRELLRSGAPYERDTRGHIWIPGVEFAAWVAAAKRMNEKRKQKLQPDQAYCFGCRKPVKLNDPKITKFGNSPLLSGICAECGSLVHRGANDDALREP